ncbi:MAG: hypothetical protein IJU05_07640 [Schwartzia sp.]|nr:hypothetical protein [Schwartzia sp. (in: firmicutes)]
MNKLVVAFGAALVVCLISMYANYRSYQERHYLDWAYRSHGGEITIEFAPGWHAVHIYAMSSEEQDSHKLVFSPVILVVSLLVLTLVNHALLAVLPDGGPARGFLMLLACYLGAFLCYLTYDELRDYWE